MSEDGIIYTVDDITDLRAKLAKAEAERDECKDAALSWEMATNRVHDEIAELREKSNEVMLHQQQMYSDLQSDNAALVDTFKQLADEYCCVACCMDNQDGHSAFCNATPKVIANHGERGQQIMAVVIAAERLQEAVSYTLDGSGTGNELARKLAELDK